MKFTKLKWAGLLACLMVNPATADYTVQIGAMSRAYAGFADKAAAAGRVNVRHNERGQTVYQVGLFDTRQAAMQTRDELRRMGYTDAFVRSASGQAQDHGHTHPHAGGTGDLANVPDALMGRVVYLDGRLHVMENGEFIPLERYGR